jgi:hypothetical protein
MLGIWYPPSRLFQQRLLTPRNIMDTALFNLQSAHVPYESHSKQRLCPQAALTGWAL